MSLNSLWSTIKQIQRSIDTINEVWREEMKAYDYIGDLMPHYEIERMAENAKKSLIRFTIWRTFQKYNVSSVTVPEETVKHLMTLEFDENVIETYIHNHFILDANVRAYKEIQKKASDLLPFLGWETRKKLKANPQIIVKNRRLKLSINWSYHDLDFRSYNEIDALERLIEIILNLTPASHAQPSKMRSVIKSFEGSWSNPKQQAREYTYETPKLDKFRIFKNGSFELTFKKAEDAFKIAKTLTEEIPQ